jgi:hypothetical protein
MRVGAPGGGEAAEQVVEALSPAEALGAADAWLAETAKATRRDRRGPA